MTPERLIIFALAGVALWLAILLWRKGRLLDRQRRRAHAEARTDLLTGLSNRRAFHERLAALASGRDDAAVMLLIDLDGFKEVNDIHGHQAGDRVLGKVAATLGRLVADGETAARLGGDEFAVVCVGDAAEQRAMDLAEDFLSTLANPMEVDGGKLPLGASIGLASLADSDRDVEEIVRRADIAMYRAKRSGTNLLCRYMPALDEERQHGLHMARDLRAALGNGGIQVEYQPYFNARSRAIVGVEALACWKRGEGGQVPAQEFIPVSEQFGLIDSLGEFVLRQACADAMHWPGITVSVNVSAAQLNHMGFVDTVLAILDATGLARRRLELEITETQLLRNGPRVRDILDRLRAEGVAVALDNFGSGYANLGYLRQFRFSRLKLDRSLVAGAGADGTDLKLLQGTMQIARQLTLPVTAEGVEDEQQAGALLFLGCDCLQGFLLGKPQPAQSITALFPGGQ